MAFLLSNRFSHSFPSGTPARVLTFTFACVCIFYCFSFPFPPIAQAGDERSVEPPPSPHFFRDGQWNATLYYFQRYRDRYNVDTQEYATNLSHASTQASFNFQSGYWRDFIGADFGVFASADLYNRGSPDHEMNFFPWDDPWHPDWTQKDARDGMSIYQAALKLKAGPFWAQTGLFQPKGPGVLGVNWSFLPGTYQGAEMGADIGKWSFATAWANEYKAPWFRHTNKFKKQDYRTGDKTYDVDYVASVGARYNATDNLNFEAAYGQSQSYLWNAHFKAKYTLPLGEDSLYLTAQTYFMNDMNSRIGDNFSSLALQQYLAAAYNRGPWTFNLEFTYTLAPDSNPGNVGYFAYRLVKPSGGAKGAYEPWWDLRSDWNHHREKAVFFKISRSLDDLGLPPGFRAGISGAFGWDGRSSATPQKFSEAAYGLDLSYTVPKGRLKGTVVALHYTRYNNRTDFPSWTPFHNAFQDEHDVKFSIVVPINW